MDCEWDEAKSRSNFIKHGLDFADAEQVFSAHCVTFLDDRFDYGEERRLTLDSLVGRERCDRTRLAVTTPASSPCERQIDVNKKSIKSDLARVDRLKENEIDYSDIPPLDASFLTKAAEPWPPVKHQLTIRLDADLLSWLKAQGRGYQTRINRILRVAMEAEPRTPASRSGEKSARRKANVGRPPASPRPNDKLKS